MANRIIGERRGITILKINNTTAKFGVLVWYTLYSVAKYANINKMVPMQPTKGRQELISKAGSKYSGWSISIPYIFVRPIISP